MDLIAQTTPLTVVASPPLITYKTGSPATTAVTVSGGDSTGAFIVGIDQPANAALISQHIDAEFRNSLAETLSETEAAFQLSFVSMSDAILAAIQAVSFIIIVIIMAVMANTMTMTARERLSEYATLKALGFSPSFVVKLLFGESLLIALIGATVASFGDTKKMAMAGALAGTLFVAFLLNKCVGSMP